MMRLRTVTGLAVIALASALVSGGTAAASVPPVEPPFGSFSHPSGIAIDQSTGNVYVADGNGAERVDVFGPEGEAPIGGGPASFSGERSPSGSFSFGSEAVGLGFDTARGAVYVPDVGHSLVDRYAINGLHEYEFTCEVTGYGWPSGSACSSNGGSPAHRFSEPLAATIDSAGDVYISDYGSAAIHEYNQTGEELQEFKSPMFIQHGFSFAPQYVAVDNATGTIYAELYGNNNAVELKRSSLTGGVENEALFINNGNVSGLVFDQSDGFLLIDHRNQIEVINRDGKTIKIFGAGASQGDLALNETTKVVYVVNGGQIQRFGPLDLAAPQVSASPASHITNEGEALLAGTVNPENLATTYHFIFGTTQAYGARTPDDVSVGEGTEDISANVVASDLMPGTTYHFALVASNALGTTVSPDQTFTTPLATPPVATTGAAEGITHASAAITGTVDPDGLPTVYVFEYGTTTAYGTSVAGSAGIATGASPVAVELFGLGYASTYHYRLTAVNRDGTSYGEDRTFTTLSFPEVFGVPAPPPFVHAPVIAFPSEIVTKTTPKRLTNAQKLANALKACKRRPTRMRATCMRHARNLYGKHKKKK